MTLQTEKEKAMADCEPIPENQNIDIFQLNQQPDINNNVKLSKIEKDIIMASTYNSNNLSDSNTIYLFESINKLDYLFWKANHLSNLHPKFRQLHKYNKDKGRTTTDNILYFSKNTQIRQLITEYCDNISLLCLAFIIMDNGTFEHNNLILSIPKHRIKLFLNTIHNTYNITGNIVDDTIVFSNSNLINLISAIYPYMFDGLKYKLGEEYNKLPICTVSKTVVFDSAHFLDEYKGKCSNLHGGRYELTVYVKDSINPDTGMVVDFTYLQKILNEEIVNRFDHHCLNYTVPQLAWRSTTELICVYIWQRLIKHFHSLYKIELKETPNSKCEYMGEGLGSYNLKLDLLNFCSKNLNFRKALVAINPNIFKED